MAKIISASIDLTKIDKSKIVPGKEGAKYYNIDIVVNDEKNKFGQDVAITQPQTKEQRAAKEKKVYLGNGKTVWESAASSFPSAPKNDLDKATQAEPDDLPF